MNSIGYNVKKIRDKKGWTQDHLATKCNLLGWNISRGTLAKMESKVRRITDIEAKLLAKALKVNIEDLFY